MNVHVNDYLPNKNTKMKTLTQKQNKKKMNKTKQKVYN